MSDDEAAQRPVTDPSVSEIEGPYGASRVDGPPRVLDVTNNMTPTFTFATSVGGGRWRGFTTREAAEAWAEANANGRFTQVVPACLADGVVAP